MKKLNMHPYDLAQKISTLSIQQQALELQALDFESMIEVFEHLSVNRQQDLLEVMDDQKLNELFRELEYDTIDDLIEDDQDLFHRLDQENKETVEDILEYPVDSAGRLMLIETFTVQKTDTVAEVIHAIKEQQDLYYASTIFVLDQTKLVGYFQVTDLLKQPDEIKIEDFAHPIQHFVYAHQDQEEVMFTFSNYDLVVVAVVDQEMNYLGYITIDYIVDVMQEELSEDLEKMGAMSPLEDSYLETSIWTHVKKRFTWLLVLMISATITGVLLVKYEHAFEALPILVSFIPMLMDTGGNSGSQASTLVIRGIATNEIALKDAWKVLNKEFRIAIITSFLLAIVNGARIIIMGQSWEIAIVVSLTLMITVIIAKLIGALLPLLADRFNLDPAVMSAPLITTIVDTASIIIYFNIAIHFFNI